MGKLDIGNRIGLSQMDADQVADFYKSVVSTCRASELQNFTCTERDTQLLKLLLFFVFCFFVAGFWQFGVPGLVEVGIPEG